MLGVRARIDMIVTHTGSLVMFFRFAGQDKPTRFLAHAIAKLVPVGERDLLARFFEGADRAWVS